ncbi:hypothetical protein B1R32_11163 [Abditibacterium utsteinense]|uniref:Uncharacterized protein n=1 Tax=Abditibacterium utsteinense TaxID=1960156 RepID=A0A2S8SRQ9_9BACT|nr:hypothetical protein [Abditibacterium utsteinense]PQV63502.1 hypothetical protein B1R32_11163 [Abditibacterium utsteinense]
MPVKSPSNLEISVTFSASELAQLEAFSALHGVSIAEFVHRAALLAAQITQKPQSQTSDNSWMTETLAQSSVEEMFAIEASPEKVKKASNSTAASPLKTQAIFSTQNELSSEARGEISTKNRGTTGVASTLARGSGPVWNIRQALGKERVYGLGWTREQLAFVLKMSVVGVRKMEHVGKAPSKSLEARRSLLTLARALEKPTVEIAAFIASEASHLAELQ